MGCNHPQQKPAKSDKVLKVTEKDKKEEKAKEIEAKIVLLGDVAVGKTAIASRFCKNTFIEHHLNTIGGAYLLQKVVLGNGAIVKLHVWDTSGQERFRAMTNLYYRDAQVAILTYDITQKESFNNLSYWTEQLDYKVKNENMIICLAGNKVDMENQRVVSKAEANDFAQSNNMIFYETSAKTGQNINELFNAIANKIYSQQEKA